MSSLPNTPPTSPSVLPEVPSTPPVPTPDQVQLPEDLSAKVDATTTTTTTHAPVTRFKRNLSKPILLAIGLVILVAGVASAMFLSSRSSELRQQASGGYSDCTGGVKDGQTTCSSFREVSTCRNGAFVPMKTCAASEKCTNGACVANIAESSSAPSVAPNTTDTYRIVGERPSQSCQKCENSADCGFTLTACQDQVKTSNTQVACIKSPDCNLIVYKNACAPGEYNTMSACQSSVSTSGTGANSCGTGSGLFGANDNIPNSTTCNWQGAAYRKCNNGYINQNNSCVLIGTPSETYRIAGSHPSLFCQKCENPADCGFSQDACQASVNRTNNQKSCVAAPDCNIVVYKDSCGANEYTSITACQSAISVSGTGANSCGTGSGLFGANDNIPNSTTCNWQGAAYRKCNNGYINQNNSCVLIGTPSETYRIAGNHPGLFCQKCENPADCGYSRDACQTSVNRTNSQQGCVAAPYCNLIVYKDSCSSGEFTSLGACQAAQQPASTTYRMVGNYPSLSCEQCANPADCGYTYNDCQDRATRTNNQRACIATPYCNMVVYKDSCGAGDYLTTSACQAAASSTPYCFTLADRCTVGNQKASCSSGEYTSADACRSVLNATGSQAQGIGGASLVGGT